MMTNNRGLLLLEVSVAIAIIAVSVVWMFRSFSQTTQAMAVAHQQTRALHVLQERIVYTMIRGAVPRTGDEGTSDMATSRWSLTATPLALVNSDLLRAEWTVSWDRRQHTRTVTVATWLPAIE